MREVRACGVLVMYGQPPEKFLLLKHTHRWDLPKGHVEPGETDEQCALRGLCEETGIPAENIELDPTFRFVTDYHVRYRSWNNELAHKTLVLFLGRMLREQPLTLTEHNSYSWHNWQPPHRIQRETIDPLLAAVAEHLTRGG